MKASREVMSSLCFTAFQFVKNLIGICVFLSDISYVHAKFYKYLIPTANTKLYFNSCSKECLFTISCFMCTWKTKARSLHRMELKCSLMLITGTV